jgi:hypothetical protein
MLMGAHKTEYGFSFSEIHATRDHNVRSVLQNIKKLHRAAHSEKKKCGMLTSGVLLLHDNAHPHRATLTQPLLKHFNWELFNQPDVALRDYHLLTYLKNWLQSQRFNNNEELMEGVKKWLSSQVTDFLTQAYSSSEVTF